MGIVIKRTAPSTEFTLPVDPLHDSTLACRKPLDCGRGPQTPLCPIQRAAGLDVGALGIMSNGSRRSPASPLAVMPSDINAQFLWRGTGVFHPFSLISPAISNIFNGSQNFFFEF
jgi:hypothetical protein